MAEEKIIIKCKPEDEKHFYEKNNELMVQYIHLNVKPANTKYIKTNENDDTTIEYVRKASITEMYDYSSGATLLVSNKTLDKLEEKDEKNSHLE
ncbi:5739_t:CDS:2 [Gigaspora rosea]|nr:5739_t:CDS:2 [Gigaspora rosea]